MKADYEDIWSKIPEEPQWHDENGVPRYFGFHPDMVAHCYADEAVLLEIACQSCLRTFPVAVAVARHDLLPLALEKWRGIPRLTLAERIRTDKIGYGDPPSHGCSGDTMTSYSVRVLQYWENVSARDWQRDSELEIPLPDAEEVEREKADRM